MCVRYRRHWIQVFRHQAPARRRAHTGHTYTPDTMNERMLARARVNEQRTKKKSLLLFFV